MDLVKAASAAEGQTVSHSMLRMLSKLAHHPSSTGPRGKADPNVRDVMKRHLFTITPETLTLVALMLMREKNIGCLPVIKNEKLVGLITAYDFLTVSAKLFEERLRNFETKSETAVQSS